MADDNALQPTAPRHLRNHARAMYERLVPILNARGTTKISQSVVEQFCMSYQISRMAYDSIQEDGLILDNGKKNPNVSTYENAVKNIRALGNDLGLSPASQVAIQKLIADVEDDPQAGMSFKERVDAYKF